MSEIQFYAVNGLIGALALMAFNLFRSWYRALEHEYKLYGLTEEARGYKNKIKDMVNSVSDWEIEKLRKTLKEFGGTMELHQAIEWFREERGKDSKKIRELEERVNFLWNNKAP